VYFKYLLSVDPTGNEVTNLYLSSAKWRPRYNQMGNGATVSQLSLELCLQKGYQCHQVSRKEIQLNSV